MAGNPNWKKGVSANPGGRSKAPLSIREMARAASPEAMERVIGLLRDEDSRVAIKAAEIIFDRAYGKPSQPLVGDENGGPIHKTITVRFVKPGDALPLPPLLIEG